MEETIQKYFAQQEAVKQPGTGERFDMMRASLVLQSLFL
jgi:hypothetical protein